MSTRNLFRWRNDLHIRRGSRFDLVPTRTHGPVRASPACKPNHGHSPKGTWNAVVIAEREKTEVVEGNHYLPQSR